MAFSFKYTRHSAIYQIILGGLCIIFGIADRVEIYRGSYSFHTESVVPIWMGVWIVITGVIGFAGSRRIPNSDRPSGPLIGTYLAFSIVSVVFAGVIIIMYSIGIAFILGGGSCSNNVLYDGRSYYDSSGRYVHPTVSMERECNTSVGLGAMIIIFAVIEFGVGIWASICCCVGGCKNCCQPTASQPQMGQVIYVQTQHGPVPYVMTQGANGVPVAVPAMTPRPVVMTPGQVPMQAQNQQGQQMMVRPTWPSAPQATNAMPYTGAWAGAGADAGGQQY